MNNILYISVILPLKLEWEPCYSITKDSKINIGDRVKVNFAGKDYIGVTSETGIVPQTALEKIRPVSSLEKSMPSISPDEIRFWRQIAEYYLCSVGEVYKAAYPSGKTTLEEAKAKSREKEAIRREREIESIKERIQKLEVRKVKRIEAASKARKEDTRTKYLEEAEEAASEISRLKQLIESIAGLKPEASADSCTLDKKDEIRLSTKQQGVYQDILNGFQENKPVLLHGITGSGKTEIYSHLAEETLSQGRNVLYLVPEIAMSRQLEERLYRYFGDKLLTFHSAQSAAGKRNIAEIIRKKEPGPDDSYIVLGTRSSLFLPHHNLGLIIIDEEHDRSYKQDSPAPRYNGRDSALMLAVIHDANVILGSATPSLESLYNCKAGKFRMTVLDQKYYGGDEADIMFIDTAAERRKKGMRGNFSIKLIERIRENLNAGGQTLILRSRRSYSPALQCLECGELFRCPHCNVSMSLHHSSDSYARLICHHCGWSEEFTGKCRKCGGSLKQMGAGTQKIEEEAAILFPTARIARLDSDSAQNKKFEEKTIRDFSNGDIDILIGTQIISKGFDFSGLSLVVIIAADALLAQQDFRADEKAVQLMEQLKGRCSRRGNKGLFIIQTSQPQHPVYQYLLESDTQTFNQMLLEERKDFHFPPFYRIIQITVRDRFEDRTQRTAFRLASELKLLVPDVTGPYSPDPDRTADRYIRCIRVTLPKDRNLGMHKKKIKDITGRIEKEIGHSCSISIDVDPA